MGSMDINSWLEIQNNDVIRKRMAKLIAHDCFRNSKLEDFHAAPESRLSDAEMKVLMVDIVDRTYDFLSKLSGPQGDIMIETLKSRDAVPEWNDPQ
ncbi:MAG: hypothetical protein UY63_C0006G0034 [Parcubacteria group bacterium GW2011_GWA2_51_10]|nr:MAG: hypothetical protein UY63_C0006G0034 [Parcubacteria group bacterium GW2011_GWA2_51_10]